MPDDIKVAVQNLTDAFSKLKEGALHAEDELEKDGVFRRFKLTFKLGSKSLKMILAREGVEAKTPRQSLKEAFRLGWLEEEKSFLKMLEDRNKMSHIYNQHEAEKIFGKIKKQYVPAIEKLVQKLTKLAPKA